MITKSLDKAGSDCKSTAPSQMFHFPIHKVRKSIKLEISLSAIISGRFWPKYCGFIRKENETGNDGQLFLKKTYIVSRT